jgi:hypothetical protein
VHPIWSFHEQKRACVRLHGRQPWPDLSSWKAPIRISPERGKRGKEEGEGRGTAGRRHGDC